MKILYVLILLTVLLIPVSSTATVFFDEDFEGSLANLLSRGWVASFNIPGGSSQTTTQHFTGTQAWEMRFPQRDGSATSQIEISTTTTTNFFFRYMIKLSPGFQIGTNGLTKHIELGGLAMTAVWTIEMEQPIDDCGGALPCPNNPLPGTHPSVMWLVETWDSVFRAHANIALDDGQWHTIEGQALFNSPGAFNGEIRIWVDNVLQYQQTGMKIRDGAGRVPANASWGYHKVYQQSGLGTMWMDRFATGDARIGLVGAPPSSLNTPTNLLICRGGGCTPAMVVPLGVLAGLLVWARRRLNRNS